jgi:hypothetical protein
MPVRDLKSFLPTAEELLATDLPKLGEILLLHLHSWKDERKVWQPIGGLNRGYFVQVLEGREQGLGPPRRAQPEYGAKQPEVTRRMLEAWNWLEKGGLLMHNPSQPHSDWFVITTEGEELLARLSQPDLEYREWMTRITPIFKERDKRIDELRREAFGRANPEGALDLWGRPVRLEALRKAVQSRLEVRTEYARRQPELLSKEALSSLRADLERFVENAVAGDPRSLPEAGDIIAELRVGIDKLALTSPTPRSLQAVTGLTTNPRVFISYSWDDEPHKKWVLDLATRLRTGGIDVILDHWHLELGARSSKFMEGAVRDSDLVLVICTEGYKRRFDYRTGGVGYEGHIITDEIINEVGNNKFIPILRHGDWRSAVPTALAGVHGLDFTKDGTTEYQRLLNHLLGVRDVPPVGIA